MPFFFFVEQEWGTDSADAVACEDDDDDDDDDDESSSTEESSSVHTSGKIISVFFNAYHL